MTNISMEDININMLISCIRALCHETKRAQARIEKDDQELEDGASEELGLYYNDLLDMQSLMMNEYTNRKPAFPDLADAESLAKIFSDEDIV